VWWGCVRVGEEGVGVGGVELCCGGFFEGVFLRQFSALFEVYLKVELKGVFPKN